MLPLGPVYQVHRFPWRLPLSSPAGRNLIECHLAAIQAVEVVEADKGW